MTCPHIQSKMVGILWMIPIYSVDSVISLIFPGAAVAIGMMRDCYEAYVLYLFLALLLAFLSNDDETQMVEYLESLPPNPYPSPFNYCNKNLLDGKEYLRFVKFGTLQYCLVRPLMALLALTSSWFDMYEEGNFDPLVSTYLFIALVSNVSVMLAFSSLLSFFYKFKYDLRPFNPVPKFLCIKSIIFCIFWQGIAIALLLEFEVISPPEDSSYSTASAAVALQDFLICIEMAIAAVVNMYAFDYTPYAGETVEEIFLQRKRSESLTESLLLSNNDNDHSRGSSQDGSKKKLPRGHRKPPTGKKVTSNSKVSSSSESHKSHNSENHKAKKKKNSDVEKSDEQVRSRPGSFDYAYDEEEGDVDRESTGNRERTSSSSKMLGTPLLGLVSNADFENKRHDRLSKSMDGSRNRELSKSDEYYESGGQGGMEIEFEKGAASDNFKSKKKKKNSVGGIKGIVNKNFAHNTAVRDFNETMPVLLPTGFKPKSGTMIHSNPNDRLKDSEV
eukprot:CAMPEP_0114477242 /NCGR_PEP_ID=MMETSP0104-20121206/15240_1 /TAXON_ID=37642 ORGANISM="Paraphysomonas imperforata, Strain PA2" /NCGR_SAMPLE_ID=MMETSP0104 /ASSEMBLY_ACC=CAM_ASM_000202 /LENGTH=501 /DNA_ID=CAMNT_0001652139 /DNA_START=54 /DNA_END=1559 /DNA_ORIENTATION=-